MLDGLVVHLREAVQAVRVGEIVKRDAVESAAARVSGRRTRIETDRSLRMQIRRARSETRQRRRRVDRFDRRVAAGAGLLLPLRDFEPAADHERVAMRPDLERRRSVRLLEAVVGAVVLRCVGADPIEPDLRRLAPAAEERQRAAPSEEPQHDELRLEPKVPEERHGAAHVQGVVRTEVRYVAGAQREAAARVRVVEERMPADVAVRQHGLGKVEIALGRAWDVRM